MQTLNTKIKDIKDTKKKHLKYYLKIIIRQKTLKTQDKRCKNKNDKNRRHLGVRTKDTKIDDIKKLRTKDT